MFVGWGGKENGEMGKKNRRLKIFELRRIQTGQKSETGGVKLRMGGGGNPPAGQREGRALQQISAGSAGWAGLGLLAYGFC